jgi:hypothetical protein
MPGFEAGAGVPGSYPRIPDPPALIAAAPSTAVVAAGFPVAPPMMRTAPVIPEPATSAEAGLSSQEMVMTLRGSLYPSQREWAADRLSGFDWRMQPEVVEALVSVGRCDPAPLVRAGCLRALAKMHAASVPAIGLARDLRNDADVRVRQEAEQALLALQPIMPARAN